jgi:hypothetical protein
MSIIIVPSEYQLKKLYEMVLNSIELGKDDKKKVDNFKMYKDSRLSFHISYNNKVKIIWNIWFIYLNKFDSVSPKVRLSVGLTYRNIELSEILYRDVELTTTDSDLIYNRKEEYIELMYNNILSIMEEILNFIDKNLYIYTKLIDISITISAANHINIRGSGTYVEFIIYEKGREQLILTFGYHAPYNYGKKEGYVYQLYCNFNMAGIIFETYTTEPNPELIDKLLKHLKNENIIRLYEDEYNKYTTGENWIDEITFSILKGYGLLRYGWKK